MANEEERELESIIRETEAPSRINGKEKLKTKIAKLNRKKKNLILSSYSISV